MRRRLITSSLVAALVCAGAACSDRAAEPLAKTGGPRLWVGEKSDTAMAARIEGTVSYDAAKQCFLVTAATVTYPVVWPHGSTSVSDPAGVRLPNGTIVRSGDAVRLGGGYLNVANRYGIPANCLPATGEVAVAQTTG